MRSPTRPQEERHKIVVVGASSVGKSSIVQRFVRGVFAEDIRATCGPDFYSHLVPVGTEFVRLQIWDTAGQERFRAISQSYLRNAVGAVLVFDLTAVSTFDALSEWLSDLQNGCVPNVYILVVANKSDCESSRQVGREQIQSFCTKRKLEFIETSALNGYQVEEAFSRLAREVSDRVKSGRIRTGTSPKPFAELAPAQADTPGGRCCR
jgi:small GTP-binding protein